MSIALLRRLWNVIAASRPMMTLALAALMIAVMAPSAARAQPGGFDPGNRPPAGFTALFNGKDLSGWQGLIDGPPALAKLTDGARAEAQAKADASMREHWRVEDGVLVFDGKGQSLQTIASYKDFELYVDWKVLKDGDSGIYLRGSPQVQIWDNAIGSGGLYNNEKNPSKPLAAADAPVGEWNRFHIIMKGERVTVRLNGVLVVDDTVLENYWERDKPIYASGPIELQNHGNTLYFKNIFVKELTEAPPTENDERMSWWREDRFGLFIHWGLYAIPAGVWEGAPVNGAGEWIMDTAKIPPSEYEKLAPRFNPGRFDAAEWARIADDAGMKYVVITTKHHDGFCLFDSKHTDYDVMGASPLHRDIMKELSEAVRARGMRMGWYHSIMDWHHPDAKGEAFAAYEPVLRAQVEELLTNYGPIGVMWFDGEWIGEWTTDRGKSLYDLCRRLQPATIVNNRVGKGRQGMQGLTAEGDHPGDFGTPEQEVPETGLPGVDWESCMTMNDTWGFKTADGNWKSADTLIDTLVDIVSKGGNFLLNVGPTAEGLIPPESVERLAAMGRWMRVNGESIYGAGASPFTDLGWGHCTTKPGSLYLHIRGGETSVELPGLMNEVTGAALLGDASASVKVQQTARGVKVGLPARHENGPGPRVVRLSIAGTAAVVAEPQAAAAPDPEGTIVLRAADARVEGTTARYEPGATRDSIGFWTNAEDEVAWPAAAAGPGVYRVVVEYACASGQDGSVVRIGDMGAGVEFTVASTGSWGKFRRVDLGEVKLGDVQDRVVRVKPLSMPLGAVMNLRSVRLIPANAK